MLRLLLINVAVTTAVSLIVSFLYAKYLHRCGPSPDVGDDPRLLERLLRRVEGRAVTARASGSEQGLPEPVRRSGAGPS